MSEHMNLIESLAVIEKQYGFKPADGKIPANRYEKIYWRCSENHLFLRSISTIFFRTFRGCFFCNRLRKEHKNNALYSYLEAKGYILVRVVANAYSYADVKCSSGHVFKVSRQDLKNERDCPLCSGRADYSIDEMKIFVEQRGGILKDSVYINNSHKLTIVCGDGHTFSQTVHRLKQGKWCPFCE